MPVQISGKQASKQASKQGSKEASKIAIRMRHIVDRSANKLLRCHVKELQVQGCIPTIMDRRREMFVRLQSAADA
jgi:hypothetical protein